MLFNSYIFIFAFLPIVIVGWNLLNKYGKYKVAQVFLILVSLVFYGYFNVSYLAIIIVSVLVNYGVSYVLSLEKISTNKKYLKLLGASAVLFNLGLIFYFKYFNVFIENINKIFLCNFQQRNIMLPLGISFFTFQQIGFVIDRCKGDAPHYSFIDYASFILYFPQLVAGPIIKHDKIIPQFQNEENRKFNIENFTKGIILFVIGLAKKVLIADTFAKMANYGWSNISTLDSVSAIVVMISYTFEIFFDFSGYCDMAMGIGWMMNIDIPLNFNSPYKSKSVKEFWNRWHITLGEFFTHYVYIPLGGNRKGIIRTVINVMIVFLLSGIWHGANWTFIVWGLMHGLCVAIENILGKKRKDSLITWIGTFVFVNIAWVLFRSNSINETLEFYSRIVSFDINGSISGVVSALNSSVSYVPTLILDKIINNGSVIYYFVEMISLFTVATILCCGKNSREYVEHMALTNKKAGLFAAIFCYSVISLSSVSTFLYFNF